MSMGQLLLIIVSGMIITSFILKKIGDRDVCSSEEHFMWYRSSFFCFLISTLIFAFALEDYSNIEKSNKLDKQIEINEQENEEIINFMKEIVQQYTGEVPEEKNILIQIGTIPELQSNEIIMKKYDIYIENTIKIKDLKSKQENLEINKKIFIKSIKIFFVLVFVIVSAMFFNRKVKTYGNDKTDAHESCQSWQSSKSFEKWH